MERAMPAADLAPRTEEVLIVAPTGQDASLIAKAIAERGTRPLVVADVATLCRRMASDEVAALVVAEEALTNDGIALLNEALESQEPWSDIPIILMTNSGETTLDILRIKKAFSPSGNLTLLERPFRRITLQSVIEVALRARRKQYDVRTLLEEQRTAMRQREEFISVAGHELRTPLTALKLQTQISERLIARGDPTAFAPERVRKLIESTTRQVDRLTHLIDELLDMSRINSGKLVLEVEIFDLSQLVRDTLERTLPQLDEAEVQLDVQIESGVIGSWDRYRIEQVVSNLLGNAIRYSAGKPLQVRVTRAEGNAVLAVRDEGPGIAPENHERIFQRFERAALATHGGGLGLGLYICREIAEAHGGSIHVDSALGAGSCFVVQLPLASAGGLTPDYHDRGDVDTAGEPQPAAMGNL
jgi:signal transduction histidine kinase